MDFSKVKGITIPQGNVKDISVGGIKVWEEQTPLTHTVSGVWEFLDYIYLDYGVMDREATVNFTSNGTKFIKMMAKMGDGLYYKKEDNNDVRVYNPAGSAWTNNAYKTVDFGSTPQEVSKEFYEWLTANATRKVISFTIKSYHRGNLEQTNTYQAYEGMTWGDWIDSSFNRNSYSIYYADTVFRWDNSLGLYCYVDNVVISDTIVNNFVYSETMSNIT